MDTQTPVQRKYAADYEGNPLQDVVAINELTGDAIEMSAPEKSLSAEEYFKIAFMWAKSHPKISIAIVIVLLFVFHIL